jgi:hypothetical protein
MNEEGSELHPIQPKGIRVMLPKYQSMPPKISDFYSPDKDAENPLYDFLGRPTDLLFRAATEGLLMGPNLKT